MNLERLRWGEWIAAISALDLLLVTFRAWYKVSGGSGRVTAWDGLDNGRYLIIATAVVGIFLLILKAAEDTQQLSFPPGWLAAGVGLVCTVYIAYRLATPPSDNLDADIGLFLGLASALGVTIGGLLSARESEAGYSESPLGAAESAAPGSGSSFGGATGPADAAGSGAWSPAPPAPATTGWSPAAAAAPPLPPATPAGAGAGGGQLRAGDSVVLTAGNARFPAGTVAHVVEAFAGGALVEVRAADGVAERFEVPESAYDAAPAGDSWTPGMPAPASQDWGFDERADAGGEDVGAAGSADEPGAAKVPWWKREIGGGKKKKDDHGALEEVGAAGAVAAGAAAFEAGRNGAGDEKPGFFKRLFGGGSKADSEPQTETLEADSTPSSDVAGVGQAAESDTAIGESHAETSAAETPHTSEPGPAAAAAPEVVPATEPIAAAPDLEPEPMTPAPDPEPMAAAPEPAPEPIAAAPDPEPEPTAAAPEPEPTAAPVADPEPPAAAPEPEVIPTPDPAPDPQPSAPEPAAAAPDAEAGAGPKPRRQRSSGTRRVPKEVAAAAAGQAPPKVGDRVELKVGGGRFDAGTRGTVVDVFSAGVIVELNDADGRSERLDLPFEAIGPADA